MALSDGRSVQQFGEGGKIFGAVLTPTEIAALFSPENFGPDIWEVFGPQLEVMGTNETDFLAATEDEADFWSAPMKISFELLPLK